MRAAVLPLILLIASSLAPHGVAEAPPPYSEELQILFLSSPSHVFRLHFRGVNATPPQLAGLETRYPGLDGYTITVAHMAAQDKAGVLALLDLYQAYPVMADGSGGLVHPGIRVALRGDRDSTGGFAQELALMLGLNLVEDTEGVFIGQGDLQSILKSVVWQQIPHGGLGDLLSLDEILQLDFLRVTMSFDRAAGAREVIVTGLRRVAITPGPYSLPVTFPASKGKAVNASRTSASTSITLSFIGSLIESAQGISYVNSPAGPNATARLDLEPGQRLPNINITLSRPPPLIIATRSIDRGSVGEGRDVEVTLLLRNLAPADSIPARNITIKEDWWSRDFRFVAGDKPEQVIGELKGQGEVKLVYRLAVAGRGPKYITQQPHENVVTYQYRIGNTTRSAMAFINTTPLVLNAEGPAISASIRPKEESGIHAWGPVRVLITVTNYGNRSAFDIEVGGLRRASLSPRESWSFEKDLIPDGATAPQIQRSLLVRWLDGDIPREGSTNSLNILLTYTTSRLPMVTLGAAAKWRMVNGTIRISLNYTINVVGSANLSSFQLLARVGGGLKVVDRGNFTDRDGLFGAVGERLTAGTSKFRLELEAGRPDNFILPPARLSYLYAGLNLTRLSNVTGAPAAVYIDGRVSHAQAFPRFNVTFTAMAINNGTQPIFKVRIAWSDNQVQVSQGTTSLTLANLTRERGPATLNFTGFLRAPGDYNISGASVEFEFAGVKHVVRAGSTRMVAHEPVRVTLRGPGRAMENVPFTLQLDVENRSPLNVSLVTIQLGELPPYIELLSGGRVMSVESLGPGEKRQLELTLKAIAPASLEIPPPKVTFGYSGATLLGESQPLTVVIEEEMLLRYAITTLVAALLLSITAYLVRSQAPKPTASRR